MDTTAWRWFPLGLGVAMAAVFAVNGYMVYDAVSTFPGVAGTDGFDLSNGYGRVLDAEQQQAALGWHIDAQVDDARYPVLKLTDPAGAPLGATVDAQAERPVGPKQTTSLTFQPGSDGGYRANTTLFSGQWDMMLAVHANGHVYTTTRRIIVR